MAIKTASTRKTTSSSSLSSTYSATAIIRQVIITDSNYIALDNTVDTAVSNAGGYIKILGIGFMSGYSLYFNGVAIATSTLISSNEILAVIPSIGNGSYTLTLFNTNNTGALYILTASGFPTWTTSSYTTDTTTINIQLVVAGDAPLTYELQSGSTLPAGISLTSTGVLTGTISGVLTTDTTYSFTVIVTDAQLQSVQQLITLNIAFGDSNFKYTTLLLNGETTVTPFINDASTNSFGLTIAGDTKPTLFSPYQGDGYYSNYFDGTGDFLSTPAAGAFFGGTFFATGKTFTVEAWLYQNTFQTAAGYFNIVLGDASGASGTNMNWSCGTDIANKPVIAWYDGTSKQALAANALSLNTWNHVAWIVTAGVTTIYVNGINQTLSGTTTITNPNSSTGIVIGVDRQRYYTGFISNLRAISDTASYSSGFTPSTTPLTAITNTSLLTCQSNRLIDKSTNAFTITKAGDTLISPAIPFTANSSYSTYGSTYFDGTGDYLTIPSNSAFAFGTGDFTVEFWVYLSVAVTSGEYSMLDCASSGQFGVSIQSTTIRATVTTITSYTFTQTLTASVWYHIAFCRVGTTLTCYVNGISIGTNTVSNSFTSPNTLNIGRNAGANNSFVNGYISDLRIVKGTAVYTGTFTPSTTPLTAITNTSLLTLQYNGGATNQAIIDNGPFNNIITRVGNTSQGSFSPYSVTGWSNYFDGTGDYLSVPGNAAFQFTADFTVECWVYLQRVTGYQVLVGQYPSAGVYGWMFQMNNGATMRVIFNNSATTGAITTSATLAANQWYHVALTRSGTGITLWFNGTSVGTSTLSGNIGTVTDAVWIGNGGSTDYVQGYISNVRIIKGTGLYTTTFTPSTTPLTPITNTSLLTCQSNRIIDNSPNSFTITKNGDTSVQALSPFGSVPEATPISYSNYFDGTGDYLSIAQYTPFLFSGGNFTIECWIYPMTAGTERGIVNNWNGGGAFSWRITTGTVLQFIYTGAASGIQTNTFTGSTTISANVWTHVALVRVGNTLTFYINGVADPTTFNMASFPTIYFYNGANKDLRIGVSDDTGNFFTGFISNVRIIKGTGLYTTSFTPSTTPLTTTSQSATASQVSLLTCQSTTMIDNSTNAFTITVTGDVKPRQFNPLGYTGQSGTSYTPSTHGGSAYFDGTGDYLDVTHSTNQWIGANTDFTIECWFNLTGALGSERVLIAKGYQGSPVYAEFGIVVASTTNLLTGLVSSSGGSWLATPTDTVAITTNTWNHVAMVRSGTTITLYKNGAVAATSTGVGAALYNHTETIRIGQHSSGSNFMGYISNARVVIGTAVYTSSFIPPTQTLGNYSATYPSSLLLNFNNGGIVDQHSTNVLETVGNAQLSTSVKKYNVASMSFNATTQSLNMLSSTPNFAFGTGDFTVEFWINFTNTSNRQDIVWLSVTGSTSDRMGIIWNNTAGNLTYYISPTVSNAINATWSPSAGIWYHIALTRASGSSKIFINGTQTGSTYTDARNYSVPYSLYVGQDTNGMTSLLNGYIDDLRITKGFARYTANFTAPTGALSVR